MSTNFSRYEAVISGPERIRQFKEIHEFVDLPYEGHEEKWSAFMATSIRLGLCYLDAVRKVISEGRWRAKFDPLGFVRKAAQGGALSGNLERNRTRAYAGRAIDAKPTRAPGNL